MRRWEKIIGNVGVCSLSQSVLAAVVLQQRAAVGCGRKADARKPVPRRWQPSSKEDLEKFTLLGMYLK